LGNHALALGYFDLAIKEAVKKNAASELNKYYTSLSQYYFDTNQKDSSAVYAKKAIAIVHSNALANSGLKSAKLLLDIYIGNNNDSQLSIPRSTELQMTVCLAYQKSNKQTS